MANVNYDPNARYDMGPNAAGCGRASVEVTLTSTGTYGLTPSDNNILNSGGNWGTDGVLANANLRIGLNAAGVHRNNPGPNVQGAPRSVNST